MQHRHVPFCRPPLLVPPRSHIFQPTAEVGRLVRCNPRKHEMGPSWHRDTTWWGEGKSYFAQKEIRGDTPADYTDEVERRLWKGESWLTAAIPMDNP